MPFFSVVCYYIDLGTVTSKENLFIPISGSNDETPFVVIIAVVCFKQFLYNFPRRRGE